MNYEFFLNKIKLAKTDICETRDEVGSLEHIIFICKHYETNKYYYIIMKK